MLNIIDAEVMIGDGGFTPQSAVARAKTRSLYQAVKELMVSFIKYVERKVKRKVKSRKEYLGEERTRKKEKKQEKTFHGLRVPPLVHTRSTAASECGHFPHQVLLFPTVYSQDL